MFGSVRIVAVVLAFGLLSTVGFGQRAERRPTQNYVASVTMRDGTSLTVHDILVRESASGFIGGTPRNTVSEFYYTVEKSGAKFHRAIEFKDIESIDFLATTEPGTKEFKDWIGFNLKLRDGGTIHCNMPEQTIEVTSAKGAKERLRCGRYASDVFRSGREIQGQPYTASYFVGKVIVDGEQGQWEQFFGNIAKVTFQKP